MISTITLWRLPTQLVGWTHANGIKVILFGEPKPKIL